MILDESLIISVHSSSQSVSRSSLRTTEISLLRISIIPPELLHAYYGPVGRLYRWLHPQVPSPRRPSCSCLQIQQPFSMWVDWAYTLLKQTCCQTQTKPPALTYLQSSCYCVLHLQWKDLLHVNKTILNAW